MQCHFSLLIKALAYYCLITNHYLQFYALNENLSWQTFICILGNHVDAGAIKDLKILSKLHDPNLYIGDFNLK